MFTSWSEYAAPDDSDHEHIHDNLFLLKFARKTFHSVFLMATIQKLVLEDSSATGYLSSYVVIKFYEIDRNYHFCLSIHCLSVKLRTEVLFLQISLIHAKFW